MTGDQNSRVSGHWLGRWVVVVSVLVGAIVASTHSAVAQVDDDRMASYLVLLEDGAVDRAVEEAKVQQRAMESAHADLFDVRAVAVDNVIDQVLLATGSASGNPTYRFHEVVNGFAVELNAAEHAALQGDARVATIERDRPMRLYEDQADPAWGLDRIDQRTQAGDDQYSWDFDGAGVNLYVVDTGIRLDHEEFTGRIAAGADLADGDDDPSDCAGHGTHVSSAAAGTTWGVAKAATIHPVRVFRCVGSTPTSVVIAGLEWIGENHVLPAVVNMSLGREGSATTESAVSALTDMGITVVAAAGNGASDACREAPASEGSAITVGATTEDDTLAGFSNWGQCVDLLAPGDRIRGAGIASPTASRSLNGTSMAAPYVAGAAALVLSQHPDASPAQVMDLLVEASTQNAVSGLDSGTPNRLLHTLGIRDVLPPTLEVQPNLRTRVGAAVNGQLEISGPGAGGAVYTAEGLPPGVSLTADGVIDGAPSVRGRFNVEISVVAAGRTFYRRFQWHVVSAGNRAPVIQTFATDVTVLADSTPRFWFHVSDPDIDFAGIDFSAVSDDLVIRDTGFGSTPEARRLQISNIPEGTHEIQLQAYDLRGQEGAVETFRITAVPSLPDVPNPDPALESLARINAVFNEPVDFQLAAVGDDPNIRFGSSPLPPGLALDTITGRVTGAPGAVGDFEVRATIVNLQGSTASQRFTVRVTLTNQGEPEPAAAVRTSCAGSDGRIDVELQNPTLSAVSFTVSVGGEPDSVLVVAPQATDLRSYESLDDGSYQVGVNLNGQLIFNGREVVECDPPPVEVAATTLCLNEDGRIDIVVSNVLDDYAVFRATFDGRLPRSTGLSAGAVNRLTITGRSDGPIDIRVTRNEELVYAETITVACDVIKPIEVTVGCLAGNGRIDVTLMNDTENEVDYMVVVGALNPRAVRMAGGDRGRITATGRPDGTYEVRVVYSGTTYSEMVEVDCDPGPPPVVAGDGQVVVRVSCIAENGRIDVLLSNTTLSTATYSVVVGDLDARVHTLDPGRSVLVTVTGRPDGPIPVVVIRGTIPLRRDPVMVACDV